MTSTTQQCPDCRQAQLFDQMTDEDRDEQSPEWACTVCGAALIVDPLLETPTVRLWRRTTA